MSTDGPPANSFVEPRKKGWLTKQGGTGFRSNWRKRWFILDHHYIFYYTSEKDRKPVGVVCLADYKCCRKATPKESKKGKPTFVIEKGEQADEMDYPVRSYHIFADTEDDMESWIYAINSEIQPADGTRGRDFVSVDEKAFDELSTAVIDESPKLTHLTAARPKVKNRRAPRKYIPYHEEDTKEDSIEVSTTPSPTPSPSHSDTGGVSPITAKKQRPLVPLKPKSSSFKSKNDVTEETEVKESLSTTPPSSEDLINEESKLPSSVSSTSSSDLPVNLPVVEETSTKETDTKETETDTKETEINTKKTEIDTKETETNAKETETNTKKTETDTKEPINTEEQQTKEDKVTVPVQKPRPPPPVKPKKRSSSKTEAPTDHTPDTPEVVIKKINKPPPPRTKPKRSSTDVTSNEASLPAKPIPKPRLPKSPSINQEEATKEEPVTPVAKEEPVTLKTPVAKEEPVTPVAKEEPVTLETQVAKKEPVTIETVAKEEPKEPVVMETPVAKEEPVTIETPVAKNKVPAVSMEETVSIMKREEEFDKTASLSRETVKQIAYENVVLNFKSDGEMTLSAPEKFLKHSEINTDDTPPPTCNETTSAPPTTTPTDEPINNESTYDVPKKSRETTPTDEPINNESTYDVPKKSRETTPTDDNTYDVPRSLSTSPHPQTTPIDDDTYAVPRPQTTSPTDDTCAVPRPKTPIDDTYDVPHPKTPIDDTYDVPRPKTPIDDYAVPRPQTASSTDSVPRPQTPGTNDGTPNRPLSHTPPIEEPDYDVPDRLRPLPVSPAISNASRTTSVTSTESYISYNGPPPERDAWGYAMVNKKKPPTHLGAEPQDWLASHIQNLEEFSNVPEGMQKAREILRLAKIVKAEVEELRNEAEKELALARRERHDAELLKKNASEILRMAKEKLHGVS